MILKIRIFINKLRIFKRFKEIESLVGRLREENYNLKGQLMDRRKTINWQTLKIIELTNDLNLLGEKLDKVETRKKKGEKVIAEHVKVKKEFISRREEFLHRVKSRPDVSITSFDDYKFWISEPFIVDKYKVYEPAKDDVDGISVMRGLGKVFDKIDEKK